MRRLAGWLSYLLTVPAPVALSTALGWLFRWLWDVWNRRRLAWACRSRLGG